MLRFLRAARSTPGADTFRRYMSNAEPYRLYADLDNPNSPLRRKANLVKIPLSPEDIAICQRLKTVHGNEQGCVGFAAPQFGISKRIIVVGINNAIAEAAPDCEGVFPLTALINPQIIPDLRFGKKGDWETCFSDRYYAGFVERALVVSYCGVNERGQIIKGIARGLLARVLQHESDHLDGIMFKDKAVAYEPLKEVYGIDAISTATNYAADAVAPVKRHFFSR